MRRSTSAAAVALTLRDTALLSRALRKNFAQALQVDEKRLAALALDSSANGCDASWKPKESYLCTKLSLTVLADPTLEATDNARAEADLNQLADRLGDQVRVKRVNWAQPAE